VDALLLQDWLSVSLTTSVPVTQGASGWLDVADYEDLVFYLHVTQATNSPTTITYQTAPVAQDSAFVNLIPAITLSPGTVRTDQILAAYAQTAPARYVRWVLTPPPGAGSAITFRIWVAAYAPAIGIWSTYPAFVAPFSSFQ
jgi:hypothetical protein